MRLTSQSAGQTEEMDARDTFTLAVHADPPLMCKEALWRHVSTWKATAGGAFMTP